MHQTSDNNRLYWKHVLSTKITTASLYLVRGIKLCIIQWSQWNPEKMENFKSDLRLILAKSCLSNDSGSIPSEGLEVSVLMSTVLCVQHKFLLNIILIIKSIECIERPVLFDVQYYLYFSCSKWMQQFLLKVTKSVLSQIQMTISLIRFF